jgi:hypothetical protein
MAARTAAAEGAAPNPSGVLAPTAHTQTGSEGVYDQWGAFDIDFDSRGLK